MHWLDALIRPLVQAIPRRTLLRLGVGGALGALVTHPEDAGAKRKGKRRSCPPCRQRKKGKCKGVQPDGTACADGVCQAGVCGPRSPETRLDATCTGPADPDNFFDVEGRRFVQAFTALSSGALVQAEMTITKVDGSTGDFILDLVATDGSGGPTLTALASAVLTNQQVAPGTAPRTFVFGSPAQVVAGVSYALALDRTNLGRIEVSRLATPTCGKRAFIESPDGLTFIELNADLIIRTFVRS